MQLAHAASRLTKPSLSVLVANGVTNVMVPAENSFREGGDRGQYHCWLAACSTTPLGLARRSRTQNGAR
jgi:hypothetical protein